MQSLASQFYAFVVTILVGLTIGVLFDFYKFSKGVARPGKILGYITDVSFWVISTLTVFLLLLIGNWGDMRMYVVVGVLIGAAVYFKLLSSLVLRVMNRIFHLLKIIVMYCAKIIGITWMVITYPFVLVRNIIVIPIGYLSVAAAKGRRATSRLAGRVIVTPTTRIGNSIRNRVRRRWRSFFKKS